MKSLADDFARDGFVVVRNIFSRDEIQDLRLRVQRQFEADQSEQKVLDDKWNYTEQKVGKGDLLSKPLLRDIVLDKRILNIASALLPPKPLVYFGDSSYSVGSGSRGFHRDNFDNKKAQGPDWVSPYTIIRMGIYLQDHVRHSGGLKVKVGSHLRDNGAHYLVDSAIGDVVVWNLRTLHSGNAVRLRFWPNFHWIRPQRHLRRLKIGEGEIPIWMRLPLENQRMVLFMSFGVESLHLDRFIAEYLNKEPEPRERMKVSRFGEDVWETARARQLTILRVHPDYGTPLSR